MGKQAEMQQTKATKNTHSDTRQHSCQHLWDYDVYNTVDFVKEYVYT